MIISKAIWISYIIKLFIMWLCKIFLIVSFQYESSSLSNISLIEHEHIFGGLVDKYFTCTEELHIVSLSNKNIHLTELRHYATICSWYLSPSNILNT